MRVMVLASVGVLAVCVAAPALAAEQNFSAYSRADQAYNVKWDRCEALASKEGHGTWDKGLWGLYRRLCGEERRRQDFCACRFNASRKPSS
jgi:hypothetical protein